MSEGDGLPLGEGDVLVVMRLSGAEVSLLPHPLQRVKASKNERGAINFFMISSKECKALEKANDDVAFVSGREGL